MDTKCLSFLTMACLAMLANYATPTMACVCTATTPLQKYCDAEYAALVRVESKNTNLDENQQVYKVQILLNYKTTKLSKTTLVTPLGECSPVTLDVGQVYTITGRSSHLTSCDYIERFRTMRVEEKVGFAKVYSFQCNSNLVTLTDEVA